MSGAFSENPWHGRRVLVTGHTGFKGSWLAIWLHRLGASVSGLALPPPTDPSNFELSGVRDLLEHHFVCDVRDFEAVREVFDAAEPDTVFHLAAQPIVRAALDRPRETFEVNVTGTLNVLDAIRIAHRPCCVVVVTSDKCYERTSSTHRLREDDRLGGTELYGTTKAAAELVTAAYRSAYFGSERISEHGVTVATVRAGNVIGGGDWAPDRILPDVARALGEGRPVGVRNPDAIRPWQHVLEPLSGYLLLAEQMMAIEPGVSGAREVAARLCSAWNFGPKEADEVPVRTIVESAVEEWGSGEWVSEARTAPNHPSDHEAPYLKLDSERAARELGWRPVWDYREAVGRAVRWYMRHAEDPAADMSTACLDDIATYQADASSRRRPA